MATRHSDYIVRYIRVLVRIMSIRIMEFNQLPIEEFQNCKNKMTASSRSTFFERKVHKFKKMLRKLLKQKVDTRPPPTPESIQNDINEALEQRLKEDITASAGVRGDAIRTIVDETLTLMAVSANSCTPLPVHFVCTAPGRFSWTFLPPADNDICLRGDSNPITGQQSPQQQTPVVVTC